MDVEHTQVQGADARRVSQELSHERTHPPVAVPGYDPEKFLGDGAFGEVWLAKDTNTGRRVAIKFYNHRDGLDWSLLSREVEKLALLFSDRYVVQLVDVGWNAETPYYVMEYLEEGSLDDRITDEGALPVDDAVALARDIAIGLVHSHGKGVLHCDLKPANVLLDQDGIPRLCDFGQSRLSSEQNPALGTLFYMAPEQADLKAVPDAAWDVYALGALLYCMITGAPPHRTEENIQKIEEAETLDQRLAVYRRIIECEPKPKLHRRTPGVDRQLADTIDRCLEPRPSRRFSNPQQVLNELELRNRRRARRPILILGALGPLLLLSVVAMFAASGFNTAVNDSKAALTRRAVVSNQYAAWGVAGRVIGEVRARWQALENEAQADDLSELIRLQEGVGQADSDLQKWLAAARRRSSSLKATSWFINDANGRQIARLPLSQDTIGKNYSFRDYFHGQGGNSPENPTPITHPHVSEVFVSKATGNRMVAFSVPIFASTPEDSADLPPAIDDSGGEVPPPGRGEIIGVLAMTVELGRFSELQGSQIGGDDQMAVLVYRRLDGEGRRRGLVLEHPYLAEIQQHNAAERKEASDQGREPNLTPLPAYYLNESTAAKISAGNADDVATNPSLARAVLEDYQDPVGRIDPKYDGSWLAVSEPIVVTQADGHQHDTGWSVVVQEVESSAMQPVVNLRSTLIRHAFIGLGIVVVVIGGMWVFVFLILSGSSRLQVINTVRRRLGLASTTLNSLTPGTLRRGNKTLKRTDKGTMRKTS